MTDAGQQPNITDPTHSLLTSRNLVLPLAGALLILIAAVDWLGVGLLWPLRFPIFVVMILLLLAVAWSISRRFNDPIDESDLLILDAVLIALALMALIGLALGTAGLLSFRGLVLASGVLAFAPLIASRKAPNPVPSLDFGGGEKGEGARCNEDTKAHRHAHLLLAFVLIGLAVFAFVQGIGGRILRPPIGDPIAYHLPFAVEWLQFGDLSMPAAPAGDPSPPFYPLNSSLWMFWLLAPFESEVLARFVQAPFLVILFIAVWRLAIELRLGKLGAIVAGTLAVTVPDIARSTSTPENDLILAALLVAATAYLALLWRAPTAWRALMIALVFGLAAGAKVTALPYLGLLGLVWLGLIVIATRHDRMQRPLLIIGGGLGLMTLLGGYSYFRNLIVMGNPLYPAGYEVMGRRVLDGLYIVTREWRVTHAFYPFDWSGFFLDMRRTFGASVTFWALPGIALAGGVALWRDGRGRLRGSDQADLLAIALLAWTVVAVGIFWFIIPYHWARFLYPAVVWGMIVAAWGIHRVLTRISPRFAEIGLALVAFPVIIFGLLQTPLDPAIRERPIYWLAFAGCVAGTVIVGLVSRHVLARSHDGSANASLPGGAASSAARGDTPRRRYGWLMVLLAFVATSAIWPTYENTYRERRIDEWRLQIQSFNQLAGAWEWVEHETRDQPADIAVAGTNEILPLYGPRFDNRLHTIWHSGEDVHYDWGDPYQHFGEPNRDVWLSQIDRQEIDLIYMTENVSFGGWPVERAWIEDEPGRFEIAFENDDVTIWRVRSTAE